MNIPLPIRNLANSDRKLLESVVECGFNVHDIVSKAPDAHPAQQSLMNFLIWFGQDHIKLATDALIALFNRVEFLSSTARQARARTVLERSLALIHAITPTSVPTDDSDESEKARRHAHSIARESRLIAARLTPAGPLKDPDAPPRPAPQPRAPKRSATPTTTLSEKAGAAPDAKSHSNSQPSTSTTHTTPTAASISTPHALNPDTQHPTQPFDSTTLSPTLAALLHREESLSLPTG